MNLIYISYMLETTVPPGEVQPGPTKRVALAALLLRQAGRLVVVTYGCWEHNG